MDNEQAQGLEEISENFQRVSPSVLSSPLVYKVYFNEELACFGVSSVGFSRIADGSRVLYIKGQSFLVERDKRGPSGYRK